MGKAVRAIILENNKILLMHRNKFGSEYYTLVGGMVKENETLEEALVREVREETGITVTSARPVYYEPHPAPYNEQYIYLCQIAPHGDIQMEENAEESFMNKMDMNLHVPIWAETGSFASLNFRTPQLQQALVTAFQKGFPQQVVRL